jgi:hypothetical protein
MTSIHTSTIYLGCSLYTSTKLVMTVITLAMSVLIWMELTKQFPSKCSLWTFLCKCIDISVISASRWTPWNFLVRSTSRNFLAPLLTLSLISLQAFADELPSWSNVVVAYERQSGQFRPQRWQTQQQAQEVHTAIWKWLGEKVSAEVAAKTCII